jgi:hypothetical protein
MALLRNPGGKETRDRVSMRRWLPKAESPMDSYEIEKGNRIGKVDSNSGRWMTHAEKSKASADYVYSARRKVCRNTKVTEET